MPRTGNIVKEGDDVGLISIRMPKYTGGEGLIFVSTKKILVRGGSSKNLLTFKSIFQAIEKKKVEWSFFVGREILLPWKLQGTSPLKVGD